jgi:hypothetical protein
MSRRRHRVRDGFPDYWTSRPSRVLLSLPGFFLKKKPLWVLATLTLQSATYLMQLLRGTPVQFVGEAVNILHWRVAPPITTVADSSALAQGNFREPERLVPFEATGLKQQLFGAAT